jgi:hypothetical protein
MPGLFVLGTGVTETGNQLYRLSHPTIA